MIVDIHTHRPRINTAEVESRVSYSPNEALTTEGLYSVGLHPCRVEDMTDEALALLVQRLSEESNRIWAIGEAGLDKLSSVDMGLQEHYLRAQIALSEHWEKPLVLHCVRAYSELIALRRMTKAKQMWIIHGYRKGVKLAEQLLDAGFYLSFGQYFDVEALRLAKARQRMFTETDDALLSIEEVCERIELALS